MLLIGHHCQSLKLNSYKQREKFFYFFYLFVVVFNFPSLKCEFLRFIKTNKQTIIQTNKTKKEENDRTFGKRKRVYARDNIGRKKKEKKTACVVI